MDNLVYVLFFLVWSKITEYSQAARSQSCIPLLCSNIGYNDDFHAMECARDAKMYLSLCVCIQLLKITKVFALLVPKMGLAPAVLKKALPDLFFFGVVFVISMIAFANMLYIQLGSNVAGFNGPLSSLISLARALFG